MGAIMMSQYFTAVIRLFVREQGHEAYDRVDGKHDGLPIQGNWHFTLPKFYAGKGNKKDEGRDPDPQ